MNFNAILLEGEGQYMTGLRYRNSIPNDVSKNDVASSRVDFG